MTLSVDLSSRMLSQITLAMPFEIFFSRNEFLTMLPLHGTYTHKHIFSFYHILP